MKIRLTFKDQRPIQEIEADHWEIEDNIVKFYRLAGKELSVAAAMAAECLAVYNMGCLVGFEVVSA